MFASYLTLDTLKPKKMTNEPSFPDTWTPIQIHTGRIKHFSELVTSAPIGMHEMGAWSFSKVKCLEKCPFQFFLKYVVKYKVPENLLAQSDPLAANRGKAAHEILEHTIVGKDVDEVYSQTRVKYLQAGILTPTQWDDHVDPLKYHIEQFLERVKMFGLANPIRRIFTELRIGVDRNYNQADFFSDEVWLRGVIDLIVLLENFDIIAIDHKTGGGEGSIRNYQMQLDWYKVLFHYGVQKVRGVQPAINFIEAGEVKMADYTGQAEIESGIRNKVESHIEGAIEGLLQKGYFKHVRGQYCKWCEFDSLGCKSGELKELEKSTAKFVDAHNERASQAQPN